MINTTQNKYRNSDFITKKNPNFNGSLANKATDAVTWGIKRIETGGVLVDFLFVDMLGMVLPRTYQAFTRNKEELNGKLNIKNGIEELIREISSGPSMFVIPMAFIALSKKIFGSASNIQFKTSEALTESFKNTLNNSSDKTQLKQEFYRSIFNEAFEKHKQASPENANLINEKINQIVENLTEIENTKNKKVKIQEIKEIVSELNKTHGINIDYSHNVTLKGGLTKEVGALTTDIINYSKDIVEKISEKAKDSFNPNTLKSLLDKTHLLKRNGRKFILASTFLATTAFLYSVPIMYKQNKQFPGLNGLINEQEPKTISFNSSSVKINKDLFKAFTKNSISFKGKINDAQKKNNEISFCGGHSLADNFFRRFDFNGHSVPYPILAFYTLGLMLGCRLLQARNADERREVATRDFSGLMTIVFAIPVLRNITSTLARKFSGIPISKVLKSAKVHLNPNNKPFSFENISDVYSGVSKYKNGIVDFAENIDKNGGDLRKIFNLLSEDSQKALNTISSKVSPNKINSNSGIIEVLKKAQQDETLKPALETITKELDKSGNRLVKRAEALKSIPEAVSVLGVSGFLGWFLPWFNINYTKKLYKNKNESNKIGQQI